MISVPTSLTVAIPVDGDGSWRLHLRERPVHGPTLCGLPVLPDDHEAPDGAEWGTHDGSACRPCLEAMDLLDDDDLMRWQFGYGL